MISSVRVKHFWSEKTSLRSLIPNFPANLKPEGKKLDSVEYLSYNVIGYTVGPRSLGPFFYYMSKKYSSQIYKVTYYIKWVTTFWTQSSKVLYKICQDQRQSKSNLSLFKTSWTYISLDKYLKQNVRLFGSKHTIMCKK